MGVKTALTKDTFVSTIRAVEDFAPRIKDLSTEGFESKTLEMLFSAKFKPKRKFNEKGERVTTIIDRATGVPVEAYISKFCEYNGYKKYNIYVTKRGLVGNRSFTLNSELKRIEPGCMNALQNCRYAGIGIRAHQLAVEEAILNNFSKIELQSLPGAVEFHKKCLFEKSKNYAMLTYVMQQKYQIMSKEDKKMFDLLPVQTQGNITVIDIPNEEVRDFIKRVLFKQIDYNFELSGENLKLWKEMAKSQPILLP